MIYKIILMLCIVMVFSGCGNHYIFTKKLPYNELPYNYSEPTDENIATTMASTLTTRWSLSKPASGDYNWGTTWNANADSIDAILYRLYIGDILDDALSDTTIDWGTAANKVNAADLPIVDAGNYTNQTTTEAALQEIMANLEADMITDTQIDFGTTTGKVSAADIPIADAGNYTSKTDVENTIQELYEASAIVDSIADTQVDWGTGTGQISATDIPIADAGNDFITNTVEAGLQQIGENLSIDSITDTQLYFGTGTNQINATDIPITDAGTYTPSTEAESALQELFKGQHHDNTIIVDAIYGTDSRTGISAYWKPFATITAALAAATAGDVVIVYPGDYSTEDPITIPNDVVLMAYNCTLPAYTNNGWLYHFDENGFLLGGNGNINVTDANSRLILNGLGLYLYGTLSDPIDDVDVPDSMTVQNMLYAKTGRGATFFIAASNATDTEKAQADYLCDGTADNIQIQAAIDALPGYGGEIKLSNGLFSLASRITLQNPNKVAIYGGTAGHNITIRGQGWNVTMLQSTGDTDLFYIPAVETHWITLSDFGACGQGSNTFGNEVNTIGGFIDARSGQDMIFQNLWLFDFSDTVIELATGWGNRIVGCIIEYNQQSAIWVKGGTDLEITNCKIIDNGREAVVIDGGYTKILGCLLSGGAKGIGRYAIKIRAAANQITNNTFYAYGVNTEATGNDNASIYIGANSNSICANYIDLSNTETDGVYIATPYENNVITGNVFGGAPTASGEAIDNDSTLIQITAGNMPAGSNQIKAFSNTDQWGSKDAILFGSTGQNWMDFQTSGSYDYLRLVLTCGAAGGSGYFTLLDLDNYGSTNMRPTGTTVNPTLRIYSGDDAATDYIEASHDGTRGQISSGVNGVSVNKLLLPNVQSTAPARTAGYDTDTFYTDSDTNTIIRWTGTAWVALDGTP